jgi:hypothetical protein
MYYDAYIFIFQDLIVMRDAFDILLPKVSCLSLYVLLTYYEQVKMKVYISCKIPLHNGIGFRLLAASTACPHLPVNTRACPAFPTPICSE